MFMIVGLGLVMAIMLSTVAAVPYVVREDWQARVKRWLVEFDVLLFAAVMLLRASPFFPFLLRGFLFVFTVQFIGVVLIFTAVMLRWLKEKLTASPTEFNRSRRRLLKNAVLYPATALATAGYGSFWEKNQTVERRFDILVDDLPHKLQGFCLAQLSDVHLGAFFSVQELGNLLDRVADSRPDALVITGDIFDDVRLNEAAIELLDSYTDKFPAGVWYCHGNHEHFRGIRRIEAALAKTSIHYLVNDGETAVAGERPLVFLGVDYPAHRADAAFLADKRAYLAEALDKVPADSVKILLAHHPEFIDDGAANGVILTLTGHTHGGQVGLFGYPLFPIFKYNRGLIRKGESYGYVHSGNGSWFPCRIGCPPEIAYFTLEKNSHV